MNGKSGQKAATCLVALLAVGLLAGMAGVGQPAAGATGQSTDNATITVDDDGDADHESIQAAIDSASPGDTVEVMPGTYEELLYINYTVDLVAPRGAVLNGSQFTAEEQNGITIEPNGTAAPRIEGFVIRDYWKAVLADYTEGDWVIENVTMVGNADEGIDTENTDGDWIIRDSVIRNNGGDGLDVDGDDMTSQWTLVNTSVVRNSDQALDLNETTNDWTIRNSVIRGNRNGAIQGIESGGDWVIENTLFYNNSRFGVLARGSSGDWTITGSRFVDNGEGSIFAQHNNASWTVENTVIRGSVIGIHAGRTNGDWRVVGTRFGNLSEGVGSFPAERVAVFAPRANGSWQVHNSSFRGVRDASILAPRSGSPGDATGNYFDDRTPADAQCAGAVDCGDALSSPPGIDPPPTLDPSLTNGAGDGSGTLLAGQSRTMLLFAAGVVLVGGGLLVANYRIKQ